MGNPFHAERADVCWTAVSAIEASSSPCRVVEHGSPVQQVPSRESSRDVQPL